MPLEIAPHHESPDMVYWDVLQVRSWTLYVAATPFGLCRVTLPGESLDDDVKWRMRFMPSAQWRHDPGALETFTQQLSEYFTGTRQDFFGTLDLYGTPFQRAVWQALLTIPYGETRSYQDVAQMIHDPKAVRAVGGANHANRIPIIIPCHRVIGKQGDLVGYGGGLEVKQALLKLEQQTRRIFC
ncbi:methylated-DNA--[protein]-cysteine S-methyltransferase [Sulfobacillus thermosulfidooxidans]|uniref:methylated-DNA--[protein]-cysteine S-methyltransferase n=1 Tax=Sulfobacillus thermosulfidooxidans TaxID=28034 RepID=UPI0002E2CCD0|nr:methylated-DNA--[protein]-cysteine S-methyltransferase [Sulfobacillus thermosulfidooxidans]